MAIFNKEEYMRDLEALVNIDSGSGDIDGLNKVADFICAKYESIGLVPVRTQQGESGRPYVEVFTHPEAEEVDVLFLGHLDTVFDNGTVAERPFTLSEDGKVAYGPGVGDMKAGDLIGLDVVLAIMDVLYTEYGEPKYRAHVLLRKMVRAGKLGRKTGIGFYDYRK